MASLGFRHPQFSEDLAWLPDWLQQNQSEFPVEQTLENAANFRENVGEDKCLELSSKEGGGYTGCCLVLSGEDGSSFLSGEDGSPMSYAQSPGRMLHFHLRFSYNSGSQSQCTKSQESNASLAGLQSSKGAQIQRVEIASQPVEKVRARVYGENLRRHLKDADVNAAVELSIAASEAMAIHELVDNESALKSLPATAVVEVALRVKEARLKGSEEVSYSVIKRTEEDIDLDDMAMLDAFEDVGLSFNDYNERGMSDFDVSQVKETPSSQIVCNNGSPREETRTDFDKMNPQSHARDVLALDKQPESDSLLEYSQYECRKSSFGDKDQGSPTFNVASHVDSMVHLSALKESFVLPVEKVGSGMVENALCEQQVESFVNNISRCPGEYRQVCLTEERFQSRWLGGWSTEDVEAPVELKEKSTRTRSIANFFVHETSFLSESADIAPDENSVVQIEISTQKASQLKMASEGSCDEVNEGIIFSQEIVKSSSLSSADPLCSFVPCSISTENHGLHEEPSQNCVENDGEKNNDLVSELGSASPNKTSDPKFKADNQNAVVTSEPKEGFQKSVRRQLSSLKTYSVILSSNESKLENGHGRSNLLLLSKYNREITSSYPDTSFTQKYAWQNSVGQKSSKCGHDFAMGCGEEHVPVTKRPAEKVAFHRSISAQPAKDAAALQVHLPGKRKLPLISDDRKWQHNMDSQRLAGGCFRKSNLKQIRLPLNAASILQRKNNLVIGRKRVSFSSAVDFQLQVDKSTCESLHQNCSTIRSWKRLRYCNSHLECQSQGAKHHTSFMAEQPLIFHKMEFLLTGFSTHKEKEIERLIQKHGGEVLPDIPHVNLRGKGSSKALSKQQPFVISPRKLKTAKFLYGCAIRAFILKVTWITESISVGSLMLPDKYMIISNQADATFFHIGRSLPYSNSRSLFGQVGIMLHGKKSFCKKFSEVIRHGGGVAYRTLQWLVRCLHNGKVSMGIIVTEYESQPSRHLRQCALERKIPIMTMSWIIESLYAGELLSVLEQNQT